MITRASRVVVKAQNQRVQIPCTVRGIPRPIITWKRKEGQRLRGRATIRNKRNDKITSRITISRVEKRHAGVYICTATNRLKRTEIELELMIFLEGNIKLNLLI